jgi:predicted  nucleic acid-binding Zn-ribbon protein
MAAVLKEEDFVEARIARLEADVAHIRTDISDLKKDMGEVKKDVADLRVEISDLRGEVNEKIGGLRGEMLAMGATLSGKIDKVMLETRLWVVGGALCVLLQFLSHAFHWLGF